MGEFTPELQRQLMKINQVARYLNCTERTVRNMVNDNRLTAVNIGPRLLRFRPEDVEAAMTRVVR